MHSVISCLHSFKFIESCTGSFARSLIHSLVFFHSIRPIILHSNIDGSMLPWFHGNSHHSISSHRSFATFIPASHSVDSSSHLHIANMISASRYPKFRHGRARLKFLTDFGAATCFPWFGRHLCSKAFHVFNGPQKRCCVKSESRPRLLSGQIFRRLHALSPHWCLPQFSANYLDGLRFSNNWNLRARPRPCNLSLYYNI